jgi:hypothetical protein
MDPYFSRVIDFVKSLEKINFQIGIFVIEITLVGIIFLPSWDCGSFFFVVSLFLKWTVKFPIDIYTNYC